MIKSLLGTILISYSLAGYRLDAFPSHPRPTIQLPCYTDLLSFRSTFRELPDGRGISKVKTVPGEKPIGWGIFDTSALPAPLNQALRGAL